MSYSSWSLEFKESTADFIKDSDVYFNSQANGRPGATDIGEVKRDAINALLGLGTDSHRETNPLTASVPQARSVIKSYRLDRINRLTPTDTVRAFTGEDQYRLMNRNYLPGDAIPKAPTSPSPLSTEVGRLK